MIWMRNAIAPVVGSSIYSNWLNGKQQYYIARLAQNVDMENPLAASAFVRTARVGQTGGKGADIGLHLYEGASGKASHHLCYERHNRRHGNAAGRCHCAYGFTSIRQKRNYIEKMAVGNEISEVNDKMMPWNIEFAADE